MRTTGKQCGLAATGDYQPSLRSPWLVAVVLALGIRFLFWGADLSILWRRYMFNPTFKKQWICEV